MNNNQSISQPNTKIRKHFNWSNCCLASMYIYIIILSVDYFTNSLKTRSDLDFLWNSINIKNYSQSPTGYNDLIANISHLQNQIDLIAIQNNSQFNSTHLDLMIEEISGNLSYLNTQITLSNTNDFRLTAVNESLNNLTLLSAQTNLETVALITDLNTAINTLEQQSTNMNVLIVQYLSFFTSNLITGVSSAFFSGSLSLADAVIGLQLLGNATSISTTLKTQIVMRVKITVLPTSSPQPLGSLGFKIGRNANDSNPLKVVSISLADWVVNQDYVLYTYTNKVAASPIYYTYALLGCYERCTDIISYSGYFYYYYFS